MAKLQEIKHGTRHAYMRRGCRCVECHSAMLDHNRRAKARFAKKAADEIGHGYAAYSNGCRCEVCRQAKADYMRRRRAEARKLANRFTDNQGRHFVPDITHGRFGYEECGCRCDTCLAARAADARTRYLRDLVRAA